MITILKYLQQPIVAEQFKILLNEIFKIRIFSHPLNFFHFYLIYFYSHGISSPKNTTLPSILAHLKRPLKNVSSWAYFRGFVVPYFNRYVDSTKLHIYGTCNLTKVAIRSRYGYFPNIFRTSFNRKL